jgi:hypothetical protein
MLYRLASSSPEPTVPSNLLQWPAASPSWISLRADGSNAPQQHSNTVHFSPTDPWNRDFVSNLSTGTRFYSSGRINLFIPMHACKCCLHCNDASPSQLRRIHHGLLQTSTEPRRSSNSSEIAIRIYSFRDADVTVEKRRQYGLVACRILSTCCSTIQVFVHVVSSTPK